MVEESTLLSVDMRGAIDKKTGGSGAMRWQSKSKK
jgi:hypothetical protein